MRKRQIGLWLSVLMLVVSALACSSPLGGNAAPTATLYVIPTAPGATDSGSTDTGATDGAAPIDSDGDGIPDESFDYQGIDTSSFTSFRSDFTMSWVGVDEEGNPVEGSYTATQAYTADPLATYLRWETTSNDTATTQNGAIEIVEIGEATYMNSTNEGEEASCITFAQEGEAPEQSPPFSPDTWVSESDVTNAQRILPDEQVNGVTAQHYRQTHNDAANFAGWTNYELNIWISPEGYPVRETLSADGLLIGFGTGEGHIEWEYNLLDVNAPVTITAPEGCDAPVGSDFPKMADAADVSSFGTTLSYTTKSPVADVVAFYNAQLPGLGWVAGDASTEVSGYATLAFLRGAEKVSIIITEDGSGTTSVYVAFE